MNSKNKSIQLATITLIVFCCASSVLAQDSSRIFFTSSVGLLVPTSNFSNAYQRSLALNSGIEYKFKKDYFVQFNLDFNAVKYNQQVKDKNSNFLFQNTNSSLLLAGFNLGKNISLSPSKKLFASPYLGIGYANIGEPRLTVDSNQGIISQNVTRMQGLYAKGGFRVLYQTKSKILQTIFIDPSYWTSNVDVQQSIAQAFSLLVGTRIGF
jgi:hypothetical protein